jgi:hypothetical protein
MENNILFVNLDDLVVYCNSNESFSPKDGSSHIGVPEFFKRSNYGIQYWTEDSKTTRDLREVFKQEFFNERVYQYSPTEDFIDGLSCFGYLLKNGAITTTMLKNMKSEKAEEFGIDEILRAISYDSVIRSVESPTGRPTLKIKNKEISVVRENAEQDEPIAGDFLSPPLLLVKRTSSTPKRDCDSMGAYQQAFQNLQTEKFGEAVLEFRAIGFACKGLLGLKTNGSPRYTWKTPNLFLSETEYLEKDMVALFKYIDDATWLHEEAL